MPPMPPMNTQNPAIMNEYQNYYYYNYQFPPNMYPFPPYYPQYAIETPKTLQESLNNIYQRGIVNNIIGAFFINECQENIKKNEKRKVPISMVELTEESNNNELNNINDNKTNKENDIKNDSGQNKANFKTNDDKNKNLEENNKEEIEGNENNQKEFEEEKNDSKNISHQNELKKPDMMLNSRALLPC